MPKREEERGRGLCPFCGKSDRLYHNEDYDSWRCGNCEKTFPSPSYGPGWYGENNNILQSNISQADYYKGSGVIWSRIFIALLIIGLISGIIIYFVDIEPFSSIREKIIDLLNSNIFGE